MQVAKEILADLPRFCSEVPYQIKKIAVKDAFQSFFTNVKKLKAGGKSFKLGFKSRKNPTQSCYIPHSAIKQTGIYPRISGKGLHYAEKLPTLIQDSRLIWNNGRWYLTVPTKETTQKSENQGKGRVVSVDPGIRTFATFFSENSFGQIGKHDFGRIVRLCQYLDDLISRRSQTTGNQKRAMKRAENRLRWKIRDLVDELHHKTARFLVDNFDVIFFPTFETSQMACKATRKIRKKSVRSMMTYAFFRFAKHLKHKCFETGKKLVRVCEAYSSKLNSFTLEMIPKLGSKEFFDFDGFRINRDVNGARNILCFSLVDTPYVRNSIANVSLG
jgi:putative transposase